MPSRPVVAAILLFWLGTLAFVAHRDLWPRLFGSGPPPIAIDLADEATQGAPVRWAVLRGDEKVGSATTRMRYVAADDTFQFTQQYAQVRFDFAGVRVLVPDLTTTVRVTRSGDLREQGMNGRLQVQWESPGVGFVTVAEAKARVEGRVENGQLVGRCELESPLFSVKRDLDPVPVPSGQALNPLQPVNRLANVRPGRRWMVPEVNPLEEALAALFKEQLGKHGVRLPERKREPLVAEVLSSPQPLRWEGADVPCWVIEYRGGDTRARTWVRVSDGKVLRQEASMSGERIALEREE